MSSTFPFSTYLISISIFFPPPQIIFYSSLYQCLCNMNNIHTCGGCWMEWNERERVRASGWWGKRGHKWTQMLKIENMMYCYWKFIRYFLETITENHDKALFYVYTIYILSHSYSFYIVVHMASRLYGGSSVRWCCLHCHGYCCESLFHSICAKTFFTHECYVHRVRESMKSV